MKIVNQKSQSGFTLIEVLTAGLISTLLAGILIAVLTFTNRNIADGTAHFSVAQIQTVVMDQLRQNAFNSCRIKKGGDVLANPFAGNQILDVAATSEILFFSCNPLIEPLKRYRINDTANYLEEWLTAPTAGYYPFLVGPDTAFVNSANSSFGLFFERKSLIATLAFQSKDGSYTFPVIPETIRCRNTSL